MTTVNTNVSCLSLAGGAVNSHRPACPPAAWPPALLECIPSTPVLLLCLLALWPVGTDFGRVGCLLVVDEQCEGWGVVSPSFLRAAWTWNARETLSRRSKEYKGWTVLRAERHSSSMLREEPGCDPSVNLGSIWLKAEGLL